MDQERLQRMEREAVYELLHYYDKDVKRRWKDRLKKAAGRYVPPADGIFWDTGLLANGLMELWSRREYAGKGGVTGNKECDGNGNGAEDGNGAENNAVIEAVRLYFDRWISRGMPVYYVDDTLCGVALLRLYEATSEEKYKAGADRLADYLLDLGKKEADNAGSIPYRPGQKNGHVYVDGIGMMCPFLAMYGVKCKSRAAVELALAQIKNMLAYGMDAKSGLPYHGFQYDKKVKYGIIGWGRAVGWLLMGMQGVLYWLQEGEKIYEDGLGESGTEKRIAYACEEEYSELKREFEVLLNAVRPYQRGDGGFSWQLEAVEGPADSSATAMIARALRFGVECERVNGGQGGVDENGVGSERDRQKWTKMLQEAMAFLDASEKNGRIYNCLGECMGFSQYPQVYGAYPWALGSALGLF